MKKRFFAWRCAQTAEMVMKIQKDGYDKWQNLLR